MTTVGYGDVYLVTAAGRLVPGALALVGIAFLALPAAIVTSGCLYPSAAAIARAHVSALRRSAGVGDGAAGYSRAATVKPRRIPSTLDGKVWA